MVQILIGVIVFVGAAALAVNSVLKKITIFETEKGLLYKKGRFISVLNPGQYWYLPFRTVITKIDIRLRYVSLVGQEVLSSDNVSLKLSIAASYEYADVAHAINKIQSVDQALYLEIQQAVRDIIGGLKIDEVLEKRKELSTHLLEAASPRLAALGLALKSISVKDITFPGELKKIFAEVVKAQKEALASLERARGETAALRNLANAAKMLEGNPALMQLRLLQSIGGSTGNTIVLGLADKEQIIPLKNAKTVLEAASPHLAETDDK